MRLVTVDTEAGTRAAVQVGEAFALVPGDFEDIGALLRAGEAGLDAARLAQDEAADPLDGTVLRRPVLRPGAVICVGLNYRTHIEEMGRELPTAPTLFTKLARALTDPYSDIPIPAVTKKMDYEGELAVVIGKRGRFVARERAWDYVAGLSILNDVTARDHQNRTLQWWAGKSFEGLTPLGPALVTLDEVGDVDALELRVTVNGEERQRATLDDLVFDVPALIEDISQIVSLEAGDVIATGTPGGVGMASERFLTDGDAVEVSIDRIGSIRNVFRGAGS